jgi:cell division protein FtsN
MNTHQRGIYQPLVENVPIYDLDDEEDEDTERSRLPLLIVAGLVVLAAFAGVVWLAYNQGVERGSAGTTRIIAAPEGPIRTEPAAGDNPAPLTDLSIYDRPVAPQQAAENSRLAQTTPPPAPAPSTAGRPQVRPATDVAVPPAQAAAIAPQAAAPIAPPAPPVVQAAPAAPVTASAPAPAAASRGIFLQIGAYESEALAEGAWKTFQNRYMEIAESMSPDVQRADLGQRGIWYRLRAGPFADRAAAISACERLKSRGGNCFVTVS